jgi:hypothetical protein
MSVISGGNWAVITVSSSTDARRPRSSCDSVRSTARTAVHQRCTGSSSVVIAATARFADTRSHLIASAPQGR